MKILLEVQESKADFIIELLNNISCVKVEHSTLKKVQFISELKSAVEEVELAK